MASKSSVEKCGTRIKGGKAQEAHINIAQKLELDLERDILRLFQDSIYCDIKFTVHSSSLLTHSCILRARASRFYKFIFAEFEVLEENGISVFNIYNASFTYLQSFVANIYTNLHSFHAEEKIIKHLRDTKYKEKATSFSAITPDADLFFTPKCSPSDFQKPFISSESNIYDNDVVSYYKLTVDDIPVDEKGDGNKAEEDELLLEKELAEQDELLSSFQTILSKKSKTKPNSLSLGTSSQAAKKTKPKFNRKFDTNIILLDNQDKNKQFFSNWKPNLFHDQDFTRIKSLSSKTAKKTVTNFKAEEKINLDIYLEDPTNSVSSDMDVSTTAGDSGVDISLKCQQETSPKENTTSETSGVDLTEAAINEDIPNDETLSIKQSSGSSVSSDPGTWDTNDDFKLKSSKEELQINNELDCNFSDKLSGEKNQLNEDEITRLDEMEKNMRDCEMFLYMERRSSQCDVDNYKNSLNHSMTNDIVPASVNDNDLLQSQSTYQYAKDKQLSNFEEFKEGETGRHQNNNEENSYDFGYCNEKELSDPIDDNKKIYESTYGNESLNQGEAGDSINSNVDYFTQPDILRDVKEMRTPPCTPKKLKKEDSVEIKNSEVSHDNTFKNAENNNSSSVNNYFIDASSLLDEDEIISPPLSLINFKSLPSLGDSEEKNSVSCTGVDSKEEPEPVSKKIVSNFFSSDSSNDVSLLKENERRQGEIIFKNSIPHYSKHEVEEKSVLDTTEKFCGVDNDRVVEDESEQVVPSADLEFSPPCSFVSVPNRKECSYLDQKPYYDPAVRFLECEPELEIDHVDGLKTLVSESPVNLPESVKEISNSSTCSGSPNLRRRNEFAPILSGGMDFIEEKKEVQRKPAQSQGEAWIVTFDDDKKSKNKLFRSESKTENKDDTKLLSVSIVKRQNAELLNRKEPSVEFYVDRRENQESLKSDKAEPKMYPIEKSNSSGYFIGFNKDPEVKAIDELSDSKTEKKNMFSMFIEMNDDSKSTFSKKPKSLQREDTFEKSSNYSVKDNKNDEDDEKKKPFYMFIESDSPNVKRKHLFKKPNKNNDVDFSESSCKKNFIRTQSYTIERDHDIKSKSDSKTDFECSSSDNSLPYMDINTKQNRPTKGKLPLPLNKFRGIDAHRDSKFTAWSETKPNDDTVSSESWLKTKDIQVNYRGKNKEQIDDIYLKKDSTFVRDDDFTDEFSDQHKRKERKPPERDSGVILNDKGDDSFVKLSDLDSSGNQLSKDQAPGVRMCQSISDEKNGKFFLDEEVTLSKSLESDGVKTTSRAAGFYDKSVNRSLSRLFPNLSAQTLARVGRRDGDKIETGDVQALETSEVSSSMQSSVEPSGLDISTSETDVSTHIGTTSRLGEDLLKMFLEEIGPDVVIEVHGRRIKAHKCILSSRCQYFAAMLSGGWVESAGNVISLQGFSYNSVHFALRHIYSGESRIPESLSIVELATLADMLCLDGLQEIISHNLKVKYCHSFHVPCSICSVGVIDCLPVAAAYGLDELYRKCLRWITKYFVKIWPTKSFGSLPKELLEKCYQHYVVHMTVDNVLDTIVSIDKVRGSLPNVRWAESVSRLVNKLHDATVKYIADHFSSVLTSDNFLALGKEAGWNVSRLEDSLIETIRYLPPEQACWSHARLHRILSVAAGPDPPPEMDWNENFLKLLQLIAELVENSLIKQAPRAAKSKAWRQMEPELRSRIQEAACLILPEPDQSVGHRRPHYVKKETAPSSLSHASKNRNFEIRQIKLAMTQQKTNNTSNYSRPLSLQMDQRTQKNTRFLPLRTSMSTSSVRKTEPPTEGIRKTQSRTHILSATANAEPKKVTNPRYSEVKSRYLEPKSPLKSASEKPSADTNQRRSTRHISSSDSSRNVSPALRPSNSKSSIPQAKKQNLEHVRQSRSAVLKSGSTSTLESRRDKNYPLTKNSNTSSSKTLSRLTKDENMSSDSLCTDSLVSDKDAIVQLRRGKENISDMKKLNTISKSNTNSPVSRRHSSESWSSATSRSSVARKLIPNESKSTPPKKTVKNPLPNTASPRSNVSSPRTSLAKKSQRKIDTNLVNGNLRHDVDAENNSKNLKEIPSVERSGTFLKDEPTILKKPQVETDA